MATQKLNGAGTYSALAGADLTGKLHYLVKVDTDGRIVLSGADGAVIGQIFEENIENQPVSIQTNGNGKCITGAAVSAGVKLSSDSNGKAVTAGSGFVFGIALNGADGANEIIEFAFA